MAPGFFAKLKNFFSDVGNGVVKAVNTVLPIAKPIMQAVAPVLKAAPHPTLNTIGTGLEWANKFLSG